MENECSTSRFHDAVQIWYILFEKNSKLHYKNELEKMGYKVKLKKFYSGLNIIQIKDTFMDQTIEEGIAIGN